MRSVVIIILSYVEETSIYLFWLLASSYSEMYKVCYQKWLKESGKRYEIFVDLFGI